MINVPRLSAYFYRTAAGGEPVRDWLHGFVKKTRKTGATDIELALKRFKEWKNG